MNDHWSVIYQIHINVHNCFLLNQHSTYIWFDFAGITFHCLNKKKTLLPVNVENKRKHLKSQYVLNCTLLLYSLTTGIAINSLHENYVAAVAGFVYFSGELAHRTHSIYYLLYIMKSISPPVQERDIFPDGVEEGGYDDQREMCVVGWFWYLLCGDWVWPFFLFALIILKCHHCEIKTCLPVRNALYLSTLFLSPFC